MAKKEKAVTPNFKTTREKFQTAITRLGMGDTTIAIQANGAFYVLGGTANTKAEEAYSKKRVKQVRRVVLLYGEMLYITRGRVMLVKLRVALNPLTGNIISAVEDGALKPSSHRGGPYYVNKAGKFYFLMDREHNILGRYCRP